VVYDITNRDSFEKLSELISELPNLTGTDTKVFLVGNKVDLAEANPNMRKVNLHELKEIATNNGTFYEETSARESKQDDINTIFEKLIRNILRGLSEDEKKGDVDNKDTYQLHKGVNEKEDEEKSSCGC